jgi:hypothetical protein
MAAWLIAAIERLPQGARRVVVAATALLLLAGAIASLTLEASHGGGTRRPTPTVRAPSRRPSAPVVPRRISSPVSTAGLRSAGDTASRFLLSYLKFAYGRTRATSVEAVTPGLRSQLMRDRAQVTPAERAGHPRVVSLATVGTTPGFVVATATIEDGGIAAYQLRFALREEGGRWLVSDVQEG